MFENGKTKLQGVHYSRYIASWVNAGGSYYGRQFEKWLESNGCDKSEIKDITNLATCGKLELEMSAVYYVNKTKKLEQVIDSGEEPDEEP